MNNDAAMATLVASRTAINSAINELNSFISENGNWRNAYKTSQLDVIKALASDGGTDIATWDGSKAA